MAIRLYVALTGALITAGCSTAVQLQYAKPPTQTDFVTVAKQADDQYQYVELGSMYVRVAPAETAAPAKDANKPNTTTAPSTSSPPPPTDPAFSSDSAKKKTVAHDAASPPATGKATADPKKAPATPADTQKPNPDGSTGAPKSLDPALATALIDGKKWSAITIPMPDPTHAFMVRGVAGFWQKTSISIARYDNSDITSSVSSKAENLVAKRLGQFAGAAASMVSIAKDVGLAVDSAGKAPAAPLLPFSIKVPDSGSKIGDLNDGWSYRFDYDSDALPPGTISFDTFVSGVDGKTVGYWPVLACRTATITVIPPNKNVLGHQFAFNVVVAAPTALRLQPVPIDGKLSPGTVCSSSETGATSVDSVQTFSDDLTALQQGIEKVKGAKPENSSTSTPKPSTPKPN
jgi:hypothetical protein